MDNNNILQDPLPEGHNNVTIIYESHEMLIAYSSLYVMTFVSIIWGTLRSLDFIKSLVIRKEKIESSINVKRACFFPITASMTLFGLWCYLQCDCVCRRNAFDYCIKYVPVHIYEYLEGYANFCLDLYDKSIKPSTLPVQVHEPSNDFERIKLVIREYVMPHISKGLLMNCLLALLTFEGICSLAQIFSESVSKILVLCSWGFFPKRHYRLKLENRKVGKEEWDEEEEKDSEFSILIKNNYNNHYFVTFVICAYIGIRHLFKRHFITNNLIGIGFSVIGIQMLHLSSYKAGVILLVGLFFYDIFWVFGTNVMTSVAKSMDAPILLQFPIDLLRNGLDAKKFSMLGLGDIVIPGIFIAMMHRFDNRNYLNGGSKPRNYFYFAVTLVSYALGLVMTMFVMHYWQHAQPALLYLVPCCIIIPFIFAAVCGDAKELWNYSEEHFVDPVANGEEEWIKENSKNKKNNSKKSKKN
uniref:Minor histocompatibility antigen H13 n=1 Tax=Rhabditophanes sp. KR3021 TaxID=114890 RepID=A0AC35UDE7_9BILA